MKEGEILIPWHQNHYDNCVQDWIQEKLGEANLLITGKIEREKETDLTLILRIPTNKGNYFFKDSGLVSKYEPTLSKHLHHKFKEKTIEVVAVNNNESWFLMKEIKGQPLRYLKDKKVWQKAISEYAELQIVQLGNIDLLLDYEVPNRKMPVIKEEMEQNLEGMCVTGLNKTEASKVMELLPTLLDMCDELESIIPASLEHGDLHSNNIRVVGDNIIFFDWGDASVSHPFFSTRVFWNSLDDLISSDTEWYGMVKEFHPYYLEPWTKVAPMKDLERALRISDELACVQRALSWHLYITPYRKNKHESYHKPSQWLKLLLEQRALHEST